MPMDEVLLEATQFVARCYGCAISESMYVTRYEVWIGKTSKRKVTGAPKLKSLPSTSEAFEQNVRRAHFHVSVWKAALEKDPPELAPTNFGWEKDEALEIAATSHNIRRHCSCTYGSTQSSQVRLRNGPAMRNCQVHVWNCSNVMQHFLWVSWNGRVLQHMDNKVQRYRRRRGQ